MIPDEREPSQMINPEQEDEAQVLDASDMEARDRTGLAMSDTERGGEADAADVIPDDTPDLVETMNGMVASGHIDNGAFAGERNDDDEESELGEADGDDSFEGYQLIKDEDDPTSV